MDSINYPSCAIILAVQRVCMSPCMLQGITDGFLFFCDDKGTLPGLGLDNWRGVGSCERCSVMRRYYIVLFRMVECCEMEQAMGASLCQSVLDTMLRVL